ncbi:mevalonate kinase [Actinotignum urinale]|uniref:mevalonate kinase n=1 Tax=Actinotignum urinale TaxID=190146 RepID=UPI00280B2FD8|nr:mevalonate kinase [Actinotignum urinale]
MSTSQQLSVFDTHTGIPKLNIGVGRAHGKAILFGEHAVVYGAPAIAFPVHVLPVLANATLTMGETVLNSELYRGPVALAPTSLSPIIAAIDAALDFVAPGMGAHVTIYSDIPYARGLGSSAAVASAVITAVAQAAGVRLDKEQIFRLTQTAERVAHGRPSGMDAHAVQANGVIKFVLPRVECVYVGERVHMVIADTGVPGATRKAVMGVRNRREKDSTRVDAMIKELGSFSNVAVDQLGMGDLEAMGANMWRAHEMLCDLGVSCPELNHLVGVARSCGALGAKLTGGGVGGCIIALATSRKEAEFMAQELKKSGARNAWSTWVDPSRRLRS